MTLVGNNGEDLISLSHYYRDTLVTFPPADSAPASQSCLTQFPSWTTVFQADGESSAFGWASGFLRHPCLCSPPHWSRTPTSCSDLFRKSVTLSSLPGGLNSALTAEPFFYVRTAQFRSTLALSLHYSSLHAGVPKPQLLLDFSLVFLSRQHSASPRAGTPALQSRQCTILASRLLGRASLSKPSSTHYPPPRC